MAISPEVKPRISILTDYEAPTSRTAAAESRRERLKNNSNNSMGYALGLLVLLVVGYFAYAYYGQNTSVPTITNQSTTTVAPSVVPPVAVPPATTTTP